MCLFMYAFSQFYRRLLATAALHRLLESPPLMAHFLERPTTTVINFSKSTSETETRLSTWTGHIYQIVQSKKEIATDAKQMSA